MLSNLARNVAASYRYPRYDVVGPFFRPTFKRDTLSIPSEKQKSHDAYVALQAQLSTRRSIRHFAHAAIASLIAFTAIATSAKLHLDFGYEIPAYPYAALGLGVLAGSYSLVCGVLGWVAHRREREQFRLLQEMRRELNLDDPSALLPR